MEPIENRLFDLLETQSFDTLTEDDRLFVLSNMTEQEFRNQQKIMTLTDELVYTNAVPLPLAISKQKTGFWMAPIPLYQIVLGAAAVIFALIMLWPDQNLTTQQDLKAVQPERIYKTRIVHDTVYETKIETIQLAKSSEPETVYVFQDIVNSDLPPRMLEVNSSENIPPMNSSVFTSYTKSMKNDETSKLLPEVQSFGL